MLVGLEIVMLVFGKFDAFAHCAVSPFAVGDRE